MCQRPFRINMFPDETQDFIVSPATPPTPLPAHTQNQVFLQQSKTVTCVLSPMSSTVSGTERGSDIMHEGFGDPPYRIILTFFWGGDYSHFNLSSSLLSTLLCFHTPIFPINLRASQGQACTPSCHMLPVTSRSLGTTSKCICAQTSAFVLSLPANEAKASFFFKL